MNYLDFNAEDFILDESFQVYVSAADEHAVAFWENWLKQNPHKREEVEKARELLLNFDFKEKAVPAVEVEKEWEMLLDKVYIQQEDTFYQRNKLWMKIAAGLAFILTVSLSFYLFNTSGIYAHETAYGETKEITLPDGSKITLNSNSRISFNKTWGSDQARLVNLEGEAFFSVMHKPNHQKFIVQTGKLKVIVLGTQFDVNSRRGNVKVVLNSGKVKLAVGKNYELFMKPGELVEFSEEKDACTKKTVKPELYSSWKQHKLAFDGATLSEVAQVIKDNQGLELIIKDKSLQFKKVSFSCPSNNIQLLERTLSGILNIQITQKGNQLILENNNKK